MGGILKGLLALVVILVIALGAGYLVLKRDDIPYATLEEKYGGPLSQYLELPDGVRVHYRDQGNASGPVLVLVHGFSASLHTWEPWVERLGFNNRIITLDLPGHGLTQAPPGYEGSTGNYVAVVDAVAQHLQLQRFALAGSSMGGGVSWNYALTHPEKVEALILVDSSGWPSDDSGGPRASARLLGAPIIGPMLRQLDARALIAQGLRTSFADQALVTDDMIDRYWELARAPGHRDILFSRAQDGADPRALADLATPTLIMWGEQDGLISVSDARRFADVLPNMDLITYPNVGHLPQEEHADQSAADVAAFLERVRAPAAPAAAPAN